MSPTTKLLSTKPFQPIPEGLSEDERVHLSHARTHAIAHTYGLTIEDVMHLSQRFWDLHTDLITTHDGGSTALFSIQLNLGAGTIGHYLPERPDLQPLVDDILAFNVSAQFLLTEVSHGLDAINMETVATALPDGGFDLHTPNPGAAKFMPPTLPFGGIPRIGLVVARLILNSKDQGVRAFIVPLNDGKHMCHGVTARQLPARVGSRSIGHALTYFDHVRLPPQALLGPLIIKAPKRLIFLKTIWRINLGSMALTGPIIPGLKMASYVGARYSQRRKVTSPTGQILPILTFRTQQRPIFHTLAQGFVTEALWRKAIQVMSAYKIDDIEARNTIATIVKAVLIGHWRRTACTIVDRLGAQGQFGFNQLWPMENEARGIAIAEGDYLVLSIRLAMELSLGRYSVFPPSDSSSSLARHEEGLKQELRASLQADERRRDGMNNRLLVKCLPYVEAIGHRMAYEAALEFGVPRDLVDLYEIGVIDQDLPWYVEQGIWTRKQVFELEDKRLSAIVPNLDEHLERTGAGPYAYAAMLSNEAWDKLVDSLPFHAGDSFYSPFVTPAKRQSRL